MVCKFASICGLYQKDAPTCNFEDGGPFTASGRAYCGEYNVLAHTPRNIQRIIVLPRIVLLEAN